MWPMASKRSPLLLSESDLIFAVKVVGSPEFGLGGHCYREHFKNLADFEVFVLHDLTLDLQEEKT